MPKRKQTEPGPLLTRALISQMLLKEGNLLSAIRITDQLNVTLSPGYEPKPDERIPTLLNLLIGFTSGGFKGKYAITLRCIGPDGSELSREDYKFELKGGTHSHHLSIEMHFNVTRPGVHWFEILSGDEMITRIPLTVVHRTSGPKKKKKKSRRGDSRSV